MGRSAEKVERGVRIVIESYHIRLNSSTDTLWDRVENRGRGREWRVLYGRHPRGFQVQTESTATHITPRRGGRLHTHTIRNKYVSRLLGKNKYTTDRCATRTAHVRTVDDHSGLL